MMLHNGEVDETDDALCLFSAGAYGSSVADIAAASEVQV